MIMKYMYYPLYWFFSYTFRKKIWKKIKDFIDHDELVKIYYSYFGSFLQKIEEIFTLFFVKNDPKQTYKLIFRISLKKTTTILPFN